VLWVYAGAINVKSIFYNIHLLIFRLYVWIFQKKWIRSRLFCDKGNV